MKKYCKNCKHITEIEITRALYESTQGYACKLKKKAKINCIGYWEFNYEYDVCKEKNKDFHCSEWEEKEPIAKKKKNRWWNFAKN